MKPLSLRFLAVAALLVAAYIATAIWAPRTVARMETETCADLDADAFRERRHAKREGRYYERDFPRANFERPVVHVASYRVYAPFIIHA